MQREKMNCVHHVHRVRHGEDTSLTSSFRRVVFAGLGWLIRQELVGAKRLYCRLVEVLDSKYRRHVFWKIAMFKNPFSKNALGIP
ncbi:hypothetical protein ASD50_16460 [Mesorhizobium sp. Root552]|nr:hypothetical protein ASD50_16460 [Mesorhizobium sp. Root552]